MVGAFNKKATTAEYSGPTGEPYAKPRHPVLAVGVLAVVMAVIVSLGYSIFGQSWTISKVLSVLLNGLLNLQSLPMSLWMRRTSCRLQINTDLW
jgi:hypothetical protein